MYYLLALNFCFEEWNFLNLYITWPLKKFLKVFRCVWNYVAYTSKAFSKSPWLVLAEICTELMYSRRWILNKGLCKWYKSDIEFSSSILANGWSSYFRVVKLSEDRTIRRTIRTKKTHGTTRQNQGTPHDSPTISQPSMSQPLTSLLLPPWCVTGTLLSSTNWFRSCNIGRNLRVFG